MDTFVTFLNDVFIGRQETYVYNIPMLIAVVAVLLIALGVSVYISRKNRLYMTPKENEKNIQVLKRNEAA